jgi:dienelactone hydrolase
MPLWFLKQELNFKSMKNVFFLLFITLSTFGQKKPEDFGYKHLNYTFKKISVDVLVQSKKGEENIKKPLFFFCQGSMPQPLLKYDKTGLYGTFPFDVNDFLDDFHLVIVSKPGVPIISNVKDLKNNYQYLVENDSVPRIYSDHNYLDYYVERNNFVINKLLKEKWVSKSKLVLAGHSEGSTIAAKLASKNKKITHLIYSGGNPYGRILSMLEEEIYSRKNYELIEYWKFVVENRKNLEYNGGDTYKATYDFSQPSAVYLKKLKIPVLITYGTKDWNAPYIDLLQIQSIQSELKNLDFKPYFDVEHNFFPVNEKREPNYEIYNWENVGKDWINWLNEN